MTSNCPYGNPRCLCQTCSNHVNGGACHRSCDECQFMGKAIHDIWLCSAYKREEVNEE